MMLYISYYILRLLPLHLLAPALVVIGDCPEWNIDSTVLNVHANVTE